MTTAYKGIVAELSELIRCRPHKAITGFAPAGNVATHQWGSNASVFKGRGMEFSESRGYQPGDDVRNIDWRVTARTGKTHTKLFQEERERPVNILVDMRAMMKFGTRKCFKSHLAATVASQLAWVGHDGGDRVGGHIMTECGVCDFPLARTRQALLRFLEQMSLQTRIDLPEQVHGVHHETQSFSLAQGMRRLRMTCRPGALVFVITDGSDFDEYAAKECIRLSAHAHITVIQINDALDKSLPSRGRVSDGVSVVALGALSKQQLSAYENDFVTRQQYIERTCKKHGMVLHQLQTTDDARVILQPRK